MRLGPHHLAFYRAVTVDGLPAVDMAKRYLPTRPIPRLVAAELQWIHQELVLGAQRHDDARQRARLTRILERPLPPPPGLPAPPAGAGPTLAELEERYPDFSQGELQALLDELDPTPTEEREAARRAARRRARSASTLRAALDTLDRTLRTLPPQPADPVAAWLAPNVAHPLAAAGVATLTDLATLVDRRGARWYAQVPRLGSKKAAQIGQWLRAQVPGFEKRVGERALVHLKDLRPRYVGQRSKETGIVPYEYFQPTPDTDGYASPFRRPPAAGGLSAVDDRDAVLRWLMTHLTAEQIRKPGGWERNATYRAYRREVERLWAWAVVQRNKALSALTDEDVEAYQTFLLDPQPRERWIGLKKPRWHPEWRPFTAPPSPASREHILTVIGALFDWWFRQGYIVRNPWPAGPKRSRIERPQFAERSLSLAAWNELRECVVALGPGEKRERLRALLALLYSTGLRRAELAAATVQSLKSHTDDQGQTHWELKVLGKGMRSRTVPIPEPVMAALKDYFGCRLGERRLPLGETPVHLFATLPLPKRPRQPLSSWGINRAVSEAFLAASREVVDHRDEVARELRDASVHWLRHTFATHAVKYDDARLDVLQKLLGHASINTTANNYVDADRQMRQEVARAVAERAQM